MSVSILRDKSKAFAKDIVLFCKNMNKSMIESTLTNQLLRSATSIGANIYEAQYAQSKLDFISKFEIALKECHESEFWLELMHETYYLDDTDYQKFTNDCGALRAMLISTCKTLKESD